MSELWSQSVKMFVRGNGKFLDLSGTIKQPEPENESDIQVWEAENSMVMAWLVNLMEIDIGKTYLFLSTAAEIWEAAADTHSDVGSDF